MCASDRLSASITEERFAADVNRPFQIRRAERFERPKRDRPPFVPSFQDVCARFLTRRFEFTVAIAIRFLTVGGEEVAVPEIAGCRPRA